MNLEYLQDLKKRALEHDKTDWELKDEGKKHKYQNLKKMIIERVDYIEEHNAKILKYVEDIKEWIEQLTRLGVTLLPIKAPDEPPTPPKTGPEEDKVVDESPSTKKEEEEPVIKEDKPEEKKPSSLLPPGGSNAEQSSEGKVFGI